MKKAVLKDIKEIAEMLPSFVPYVDTSTLTGEELLLSALDLSGMGMSRKDIDPSKNYRVRFLHWRHADHYRSMKKLIKKGKNQKDKEKLVREYISKYMPHAKA